MTNSTLTQADIAKRYAELHALHAKLIADIEASGFDEDDADALKVDEALYDAAANWAESSDLTDEQFDAMF